MVHASVRVTAPPPPAAAWTPPPLNGCNLFMILYDALAVLIAEPVPETLETVPHFPSNP